MHPPRSRYGRSAGPGRGAACLALLASGLGLYGQEPAEPGPALSREMFPLFLISMAYQPTDPTPLGAGHWQIVLEHMQANTFEFSDVFKEQAPRDAQGRIRVTRDFVEAHAAEYAQLPLVFFFDAEVARTSLRIRHGLTAGSDVWIELPFTSLGGGYLDAPIEGFHRIGFEQFGRDRVLKDQITFVVMEKGTLRFFSDRPIRGKTQDPVIGCLHRFLRTPAWTLSAAISVKPPLTRAYGTYQTGWDHTFALTGRWRPTAGHSFHFGAGYVRRPRGNAAFQDFPEGNFRDGLGAHFGWQRRSGSKLNPFFQLYWQSGYLHAQPRQKLDRPSLQHDLGFHWSIRPRTIFTFRYLNNITHNENTADMGIGFGLAQTF